MMHRPRFAGSSRNFVNIAESAFKGVKDMAADVVLSTLIRIGVHEQATRENRRRTRAFKRWKKHSAYCSAGLNGARAVARPATPNREGFPARSKRLGAVSMTPGRRGWVVLALLAVFATALWIW